MVLEYDTLKFSIFQGCGNLLPPVLSLRTLLKLIALIVCAPVPLKFTVFGVEEVTFNAPLVMLNVFAIPNTELAANCKDVPFTVELKRLAVPLREDVPVKVAVPAVAVNVPPTINDEPIEKLAVVVLDPETDKP